jgi:acrylyl-CoA reductase (NADPH)
MSNSFQALVARKDETQHCAFETLTLDDLDAGDVT